MSLDFKSLGKRLGTTSSDEIFDMLIYTGARGTAQDMISPITKEMEDGWRKELVENIYNAALSQVLSEAIKLNDIFIELVRRGWQGISMYLGFKDDGWAQDFKNKFKKGKKAILANKFTNDEQLKSINQSKVISQLSTADGSYSTARNTALSDNHQSLMLMQKSHQLEVENHNAHIAKAISDQTHYSNILKIISGKFSESDKNQLKKQTGITSFNTDDIKDLNKIKDFMFVKDSEGKTIGLSDAMISLVNGLNLQQKV